jgi:hypothetical protein
MARTLLARTGVWIMTNMRALVRIGILALTLSAPLLTIWWVGVQPPTTPGGPAPTPPSVLPPRIPRGLSRTEFYNRDFVPLLDKTKEQNLTSADKAVDRLHEVFDRSRSGIPDFAADVTSWSTRFGLLERMTKDTWKNYWKAVADPDSEEVKQYMLKKFQAHIMSQGSLQEGVDSALAQFRDDVTANRNLLLREMKLALSTSDVRLDFATPDFDAFQQDCDNQIATSVEGLATASVENAVVSFAASSVATIAVEQLASQILRMLASEAVSAGLEAAAAGGSSMVGGGALGGAAGWLGGPAGAVIGVGAGMAVGAIVDWCLTDEFKANLTQELTRYLDNLERDMINGVAAEGDRTARTGLRVTLRIAAETVHAIQTQAVLSALEEAK